MKEETLDYEDFKSDLSSKYIGRNVYYFDSIDSTNTKAKKLASKGAKEGTVIISEEQTAGRGRLGRSWISPKHKGLWMSIILRPNIAPINAVKITQIVAAAIHKSINCLGIKSLIKWPNDIVLNDKKLCGILTEMNAELNRINYVVIGIGINVNLNEDEIPKDIRAIATSLKIESKDTVDRKALLCSILANFEIFYDEFLKNFNMETALKICRENSAILGKEIQVIKKDSCLCAKAIDITNDGRLLVEYEDGSKEYLISDEVSVRGLMGYI
ncbi:biotin--[acetyl-CoA-carboxylase] ligase [Clostridium algidicarnis]|uniref:biotin--[acetyl-CoA-carboxylase] ligase n=1 Tax=Clostridium algidicarnis TaxID=37659 RepID=UPI0006904041|nr:biotin--[acetyl-CoA-carboxylase] ligase [Clostridium algidicarnis]